MLALRPADHAQPSSDPTTFLVRYGARVLSNVELLQVVMRVDSEVSKDVATRYANDLHRMARANVPELMRIARVGEAKAAALVASFELGRRMLEVVPMERHLIGTSSQAYEVLNPLFRDLPHEEFWLLLLDRGLRVIDRVRLSTGGYHGTVVDPKMLFKEALDRRASVIILAHNHPSGQLRPSEEDIRLTKKLTEGGRLLDIQVNDHIIVGHSGYYSFADNGQM